MDKSESNDFANFMHMAFFVSLGLLLYGGYCLVQSPSVRQEAASVPTMTCDQLIRNGAGNHRYIALTDACLSSRHSVSERDSDTGALEMYHPLYSAHLQQEPAPRDLVLILCILDETDRRRIRDDSNQRKQLGQQGLSELTGEVMKGADQLPAWVREGLREKYPGIALGKCWVLTVGNDEPTVMRAQKLMRHGIVASLAGGALLLGWLIWRRASTFTTIPSAREMAGLGLRPEPESRNEKLDE